ncbi:MAG: AsmA-like C-terminal domain-containing protein [Phycisphaerales bacterium]
MPPTDATQAPEPIRKPGVPTPGSGHVPRAARTPPRKPAASRPRAFRRFLLVAAGVLVALVILLFHSGLLRVLVVPRLEALVGATIRTGGVNLGPDGALVVDEPELRNDRPGLAGTAAQFVKADELRVLVDWSSLLRGKQPIRRIELNKPVIRISQDADLVLNIKEVVEHLAKASGGPAITTLPEVAVTGAIIELGEHAAGPPAIYTELTSLRVSGTIRPDPDLPDRYLVDFREERPEGQINMPGTGRANADPLRGGKTPGLGSAFDSPKMRITGVLNVNPVAADLTLTNVDLEQLGRRQAPQWFSDVWGDLELGGEIPTVNFSLTPGRGFTMSFLVRGVQMNIPIPVEPDLDAQGDPIPGAQGERRLLAMRNVSGKVALDSRGLQAELNGDIEDFPLTVRLKTEGRDINSALSCDLEAREFLVAKRPMLLPFAPPIVRFLFQRLGSPTLEAEGVVKLRREAPSADGTPAPIRASGSLKFKNGTAAHELFAYPISQLSGIIGFDEKKVELLNIKGSHANGAKVLASGTITPIDDTAGADVRVTVVDIPVDALFREALPRKRRIVYDALADENAYAALRAEGLIQSADEKAAKVARLADLRTNLAVGERYGGGEERMTEMREEADNLERESAVPVFELGGLAQMEVHVTRAVGREEETKADVHLTASRLGLLMKTFPLPMIARNVDMRLGGSLTTFKPIQVETPTGGRALVTGSVAYPDGAGIVPMVDFTVDAVPVDALFIRALPDRGTQDSVTARKLVSNLNFTGNLGGFAVVRPDPGDPESASFRVDLVANGLTARPRRAEGEPAGPELELTDIHGGISVFDGAVEIPHLTGRIEGEPFELAAHAWYGGADPTTMFGTLRSEGLNLAAPLERLIAAGSPRAGARIAALRNERMPSGCATAEMAILDAGAGVAALIGLEALEGGSFVAPGGRFEIESAAGVVGVTENAVSFGGFNMAAADGARAELDGALALSDAPPTSLSIRAAAARFESVLVRALAPMGGQEVAAFVEETRPTGLFDAEVSHRRNHESPGSSSSSGWLAPKSAALTRRGTRIDIPEMSGRVFFDDGGGRFEALEARAAKWWAHADGSFSSPESGAGLDLTLSVGGDAIGPDFRAALPSGVADALANVELGEHGRFEMRDAVIRIAPAPPAASGSTAAASFRGSVNLDGITIKPVVPITDAQGTVEVRADPAKEGTGTVVALDIAAKKFTLAGIQMGAGTARVLADTRTGAVTIPRFGAECHGGQLSAQGSMKGGGTDSSSGAASNRSFDFTADLSNVRFGDLLADLYPKSALDERTTRAGTDAPADDQQPIVDRGRLDGSFSIAGIVGKASSRRGRGLLRVQDGEVLNMPAVIPILRLSNLQPPVNERVGFGYADFYIQGERLEFDEFTLQSKSLAIDGRGAILWPDLNINMRFVTRSLNRVPLLTDLLEGVRDELVTTTVSGTLSDPQLTYDQLTATRQMLDQMFSKKKRDRPEATSDQPRREPEPR